MMLRTVKCGVCGKTHTEPKPGDGWAGWGQLFGIVLNNDENPYLCPDDLALASQFINARAHELQGTPL
jgi:hypothetical protein